MGINFYQSIWPFRLMLWQACTIATTTGCLHLPTLHKLHRWSGDQSVRHKVDLFHDVWQSDGQFLSQESKRGFLASVRRTYKAYKVSAMSDVGGLHAFINTNKKQNAWSKEVPTHLIMKFCITTFKSSARTVFKEATIKQQEKLKRTSRNYGLS